MTAVKVQVNRATKIQCVGVFLKSNSHCLRYANEASAGFIADKIDLRNVYSDNSEYIPGFCIERAFREILDEDQKRITRGEQPRLADNYEDAIRRFFSRHPELSSQKGYRDLVGNALEAEGIISPEDEDLEVLLDKGNPNNILEQMQLTDDAQQAVADEHERQRLVKAFLDAPHVDERIRHVNHTTGRVIPYRESDAYRKRVTRLEGKTLQELREMARLKALNIGDKAVVESAVQSERAAAAPAEFASLPPMYDVPGKLGVSYPWSRQLLVQLHTKAPDEFLRLKRYYGEEQINNIILNNGVKQ